MKWNKNTFLNLSQQTDDVGMTTFQRGNLFANLPAPLYEKRFLRRLVPECRDIWPLAWLKYIVSSVLSWWCKGWLCPWTMPNVPIYSWFAPYLVTTVRYPPPGHKCVGPWSVLAGWYQASGCLQSVKLCWECLQRISSLLALSKCLLYKY